ncbi:MAG: hypothetical protein WA354_21270, partial [Terracidiphilus sp.]
PEAAQNRPLAPDPADRQGPVLALKVRPAGDGSLAQADPVARGQAANAPAASPEERIVADKSGITADAIHACRMLD